MEEEYLVGSEIKLTDYSCKIIDRIVDIKKSVLDIPTFAKVALSRDPHNYRPLINFKESQNGRKLRLEEEDELGEPDELILIMEAEHENF